MNKSKILLLVFLFLLIIASVYYYNLDRTEEFYVTPTTDIRSIYSTYMTSIPVSNGFKWSSMVTSVANISSMIGVGQINLSSNLSTYVTAVSSVVLPVSDITAILTSLATPSYQIPSVKTTTVTPTYTIAPAPFTPPPMPIPMTSQTTAGVAPTYTIAPAPFTPPPMPIPMTSQTTAGVAPVSGTATLSIISPASVTSMAPSFSVIPTNTPIIQQTAPAVLQPVYSTFMSTVQVSNGFKLSSFIETIQTISTFIGTGRIFIGPTMSTYVTATSSQVLPITTISTLISNDRIAFLRPSFVSPSYSPGVISGNVPSVVSPIAPAVAPITAPSFAPSVVSPMAPAVAPIVRVFAPSVVSPMAPASRTITTPSFAPSVVSRMAPAFAPSVVSRMAPAVRPITATTTTKVAPKPNVSGNIATTTVRLPSCPKGRVYDVQKKRCVVAPQGFTNYESEDDETETYFFQIDDSYLIRPF